MGAGFLSSLVEGKRSWHGRGRERAGVSSEKGTQGKRRFRSLKAPKELQTHSSAGRNSWVRNDTLSDTFQCASGNSYFLLLVIMPRIYILC